METTLTTKGQITLPKDLRDNLHLKTGDKIIFKELDDGNYMLTTQRFDASIIKGCVNYTGEAISIDDMDMAVLNNVN